MIDNNSFEMRILADTVNESFIRATVGAFCSGINMTLEQLNDVKTAVSEAITNCIVHAYDNKPDNYMTIKVELTGQNAKIQVIDTGCGIDDVAKAMQAFYTTKPNEERSGMGFTLMQTFMDEVWVDSTPGEGTTVTMIKRLGANVSA